MAKQEATDIKRSPSIDTEPSTDKISDSPSLSFNSAALASKSQPRVMQLDMLTLPQFNVTMIARCLLVHERLCVLAHIHRRLRHFVNQPQCFPDMSFFPVDDDTQFSPKVLSANGNCGITYVEVNILSRHPFVSNVALLAGMWNFKADLWSSIDWPCRVNMESLQLTLDFTSNVMDIDLARPPRLQAPSLRLPRPIEYKAHAEVEEKVDDEAATDKLSEQHEGELVESFDECISPTTRKPMDLKSRLRNLFFII